MRTAKFCTLTAIGLVAAISASADTNVIRLLDGREFEAKIVEVYDHRIIVETPAGRKFVTWEAVDPECLPERVIALQRSHTWALKNYTDALYANVRETWANRKEDNEKLQDMIDKYQTVWDRRGYLDAKQVVALAKENVPKKMKGLIEFRGKWVEPIQKLVAIESEQYEQRMLEEKGLIKFEGLFMSETEKRQLLTDRERQKQYDAAMAAKGMVKVDGKWVEPEKPRQPPETDPAATQAEDQRLVLLRKDQEILLYRIERQQASLKEAERRLHSAKRRRKSRSDREVIEEEIATLQADLKKLRDELGEIDQKIKGAGGGGDAETAGTEDESGG